MAKSKRKVTKLIIPLAGFGTRFTPSSTAHPKELTHLVDRPVIQYLVEEAYASGIREVIFVLNSSKDSIKKYFSQAYQDSYVRRVFAKPADAPEDLINLHNLIKKMKFRFITKTSTLGDGHSILFARRYIGKGEPFAVSMGDLLSFGLKPFLKQLIEIYESKKVPVVSVEGALPENLSKYGVVALKKSKGRLHEIVDIVEKPKPGLASSRFFMTGKYILNPDFFSILKNLLKKHKNGELRLADALKIYSHGYRLLAYECNGTIQDTGNKLDFIKATINFGLNSLKFSKPLKEFIKSLKL